MKIGFDAKRAFCNRTGLGNYSRNIIRALAKHSREHQLYLYTTGIRIPEFEKEMQAYPQVTIVVSRAPGKIGKAWWRSFGIRRRLKKDGIDIYHGLSNELPLVKLSVASVVTMHDLIFMKEKLYYNLFDIISYSIKSRSACRDADRVIAISRQTRSDLVTLLSVPVDKTDVVYQPVNPEFLQIPSAEVLQSVKEKYQLPGQYILFVGRVEVRKNLQGLLHALVSLKNETRIPVVVVGRKTRFFKSLRDFLKIYQVKDQVIFMEEVPFTDLPAIMRQATMLCYPSYNEGFGLPVAEAIAAGIPVITTDQECFHEAGGDFPLYINPAEPSTIAEAIRQVLHDPRHYQPEEIFEHLLKFDDRKIAGELVSIYQQALGEKKARNQ